MEEKKRPSINERLFTDEEMASYRKFAKKTHEQLTDSELFRLANNLTGDTLKSEMMDIVCWEMKIREEELNKSRGVDMAKEYSYKNANKNVKTDENLINDANYIEYIKDERNQLSEMSDELLERSMKIIESHPRVVEAGDTSIFNKNGGGFNIMTKKILVKCDNGDDVLIDNEAIQEHFRTEYIKKMSEVTGIDYTKYDLGAKSEIYGGYSSPSNGNSGPDARYSDKMNTVQFSDDDFEEM